MSFTLNTRRNFGIKTSHRTTIKSRTLWSRCYQNRWRPSLPVLGQNPTSLNHWTSGPKHLYLETELNQREWFRSDLPSEPSAVLFGRWIFWTAPPKVSSFCTSSQPRTRLLIRTSWFCCQDEEQLYKCGSSCRWWIILLGVLVYFKHV